MATHIYEPHIRTTYTNQIHEYDDSHVRMWRITHSNATNHIFECACQMYASHIRQQIKDVCRHMLLSSMCIHLFLCIFPQKSPFISAEKPYVSAEKPLRRKALSFWAYLRRKALCFRKRNLYFCNRATLSETFAPHICAQVCRQDSFLRDSFHVAGLFPQNIGIFPENVGLFCGYIGFFCGVSKRFAPQLVFDSWLTRAVPTNAHAHTHSLSLSLSLSHSLSLYLSLCISLSISLSSSLIYLHTHAHTLSLYHTVSLCLSLFLSHSLPTHPQITHTHITVCTAAQALIRYSHRPSYSHGPSFTLIRYTLPEFYSHSLL